MDARKLQTLYSLAGGRTAVGAPPPPIPWRHAASRTHPSLRTRFPIQPAALVSILLHRRQGRRPGALRRILYDMVLRVTTLTPYCLLRHKEHIATYGEGNERRLTGTRRLTSWKRPGARAPHPQGKYGHARFHFGGTDTSMAKPRLQIYVAIPLDPR